MPSPDAHFRAADDNERLARELLALRAGPNWVPVLAFYAALHRVDAYLATRGISPSTHTNRRGHISREPALGSIRVDYQLLEAVSRQARYELRQFSVQEAEAFLTGELERITNAIRPLVDPAGS